MSYVVAGLVMVPDCVYPDTEVPSIVIAVNEDGSALVQVFGHSDVVEKRVVAAEEEKTAADTDAITAADEVSSDEKVPGFSDSKDVS